MAKTAAVWLWLALAITSGCDRSNLQEATAESQLLDLNGEPVDTRGRVMLVNYWAEWCAPCREEIPELNAFHAHNNALALVVGINFDQLPVEQVRMQAEKFGIEFPVLAKEPPQRWGQPRPQVLPSTLVIDGSGNWLGTLVGPQSEEGLKQALLRFSQGAHTSGESLP